MKKVAIITGATGGLGKEFVREACKEDLDEIWAVARSSEKLAELKVSFGDKVIPVRCDLSVADGIEQLRNKINDEKPDIRLLINNAGIGKMGRYDEFSAEDITKTIDLNCKAVCLLCECSLPFMTKGARILNISSASSFQPNPYINLYSASKVFVRSYSRSLNFELKEKGVTCTAVCPGWVDTDMLKKERNGKKIKFPGIVSAKRVVKQALRDSLKGKDMSVCSLFVKYEHLISKIYPQKWIMKMWALGIKRYI